MTRLLIGPSALALLAVAMLAAGSTAVEAGSKSQAAKHSQSDNHGAANSNGGGASSEHRNVASLIGGGNAAHASLQGLLHAAPNSQLGLLRTYADAASAATQLQTAIDAFNAAYPDFNTGVMTDEEKTAALATDLGIAFTAAQSEIGSAGTDADLAFASAVKDPTDPAVRPYVDGLLADYYEYLAAQ